MLDEAFRRRVGALAASDQDRLDEAARERILARVAAEGPSIARRARRARTVVMVASPVLAAAAIAAILIGRRPATQAPAAVAAAPSLACAARAQSADAKRGFVRVEAGQKLDLGVTAFAYASSDSTVHLVESLPCKTTIELSGGTVTVHAKDLGGGELAVRTKDGEVLVHGTIFAVTETGDSLSVEVVEGRVLVAHKAERVTLGAGERLLASELGLARGSLGNDRAKELRAFVVAPEVVGFDALQPVDSETALRKPSPGATMARAKPGVEPVDLASTESPDADLLAQAEAARRGQDYSRARELYRQAAQAGGATGEAALVALARMELGLGQATAALDATRRRRERFGQGTLGPEALWIEVRSYRVAGDQERARTLAKELVRTWPSSPQARAADQWLSAAR
jgi:ferric-dicitrate binding protein FerR (iron transport regulator)